MDYAPTTLYNQNNLFLTYSFINLLIQYHLFTYYNSNIIFLALASIILCGMVRALFRGGTDLPW